MQLVETKVSPTHVQIRFELSDANGEKLEWIDIRLEHKSNESRPLAAIQRAILQHARDVLSGEIQRLAALAGRNA